jgi:hypothetical protein
MSEQVIEAIDPFKLVEVTGGNSYVKECYKGAMTGALAGAPGGPKGMFFGGILGCLGGMAANAFERNT